MVHDAVKMVFLDRDGVINRFPGIGHYVTRWEDFQFLPNAFDAIELLTKHGYEVNVISNQGCVAKGLVTAGELERLTARMTSEAEKHRARIAGVFYCVHQASDACECKKPKTTLFKKAIGPRAVDLESTFFIGDSEEDIQAGRNLGCRTLLVLSGRTRRGDVGKLSVRPDVIKENLWEAARWLTNTKP